MEDCSYFVFQHYGGDISDPTIDADADTAGELYRDAKRISDALTTVGIRHRFEIYNENIELIHYLHHGWPQ